MQHNALNLIFALTTKPEMIDIAFSPKSKYHIAQAYSRKLV